MLNELISSVTHLPELRKIEHKINTSCYWLGSPKTLSNALSNTNDGNTSLYQRVFEIIRFNGEIAEILKSVDIAKNLFSKMPLKLQLKHIFDIPRYIDESTYMEDYKFSSTACQYVMLNHFMMSYAEVILHKIPKEERFAFLIILENNIHKGDFAGARFHEEDHLIVLNKWQLESELSENKSPKPKKPMKI